MHSHKSQQTLLALQQSRADVDIQQLCTHTNHNRRYLPYHRVERMSTYNSCALTQITTDATCCLVMEITIICLCSPLVSTFRFYRLQRFFYGYNFLRAQHCGTSGTSSMLWTELLCVCSSSRSTESFNDYVVLT